jgi:hypothetical protein
MTEENCILFGKSELFSALSSMCLISLYSFHIFFCEWLYLVDVHGKVHTPDYEESNTVPVCLSPAYANWFNTANTMIHHCALSCAI